VGKKGGLRRVKRRRGRKGKGESNGGVRVGEGGGEKK